MTPLQLPSDQRIVDILVSRPWFHTEPKIRVILASGTELGGRIHGIFDAKAGELLHAAHGRDPSVELLRPTG